MRCCHFARCKIRVPFHLFAFSIRPSVAHFAYCKPEPDDSFTLAGTNAASREQPPHPRRTASYSLDSNLVLVSACPSSVVCYCQRFAHTPQLFAEQLPFLSLSPHPPRMVSPSHSLLRSSRAPPHRDCCPSEHSSRRPRLERRAAAVRSVSTRHQIVSSFGVARCRLAAACSLCADRALRTQLSYRRHLSYGPRAIERLYLMSLDLNVQQFSSLAVTPSTCSLPRPALRRHCVLPICTDPNIPALAY